MNQVVAYNFRRAREHAGLTQAEVGRRLRDVTGDPWPQAAVSAAETGWDSANKRLRHVDADELVAYALVFGVPVAWFLLPPPVTPGGADAPRTEPWITTAKREYDDGSSNRLESYQLLPMILPGAGEVDQRSDGGAGVRVFRERLLAEWPAAAKYLSDSELAAAALDRASEAVASAHMALLALRVEVERS